MTTTRLRALAAAITAVLALGLLSACGYEQGPAGRVVDKDRDYKASTKTWKYELTTRDKAGDDHEFTVSSGVYDDCRRGSAYPGCIDR